MTDPLRRPEAGLDLQGHVRETGAWLVDLLFERRGPTVEGELPRVDQKACRIRHGRRIACVSLVAGCGTTTVAALVAQRAGGAGARIRLFDLDLAAPSLGLLAGERKPTLLDVLGAPAARPRTWGSVGVVFGPERDPGPDIAASVTELLGRSADGAAVVVDAGTLVAPVCEKVLRACDTVLYVTTPRAAHLHAAARGAQLLADLGLRAQLVVSRGTGEIAKALSRELGLELGGWLPEDPFLARDEFRIRAETARAVDSLCAKLA